MVVARLSNVISLHVLCLNVLLYAISAMENRGPLLLYSNFLLILRMGVISALAMGYYGVPISGIFPIMGSTTDAVWQPAGDGL